MTQFFEHDDSDRLAYRHIKGEGPTIVWLNGFLSDMGGTKVSLMFETAKANNWDFLGFDYFAHGETGGDFAHASLGRWRSNVLSIVDNLTTKPLVVIGSSMGGWLASLLIKDRPHRVLSLGLIAPAADFTRELLWPSLSPEDLRSLAVSGSFMRGTTHRPVAFTREFFAEADAHLVLGDKIDFEGRVEILHGMKDDSVPWQHGVRLAETISSQNVQVSLIKDGDHRLSRPQDLSLLLDMVESLRKG